MRKILSILAVGSMLVLLGVVGGYFNWWENLRRSKQVADAETREEVLELTGRIDIHVSNDLKILSYVGDESIFGYTEEELIGKPIAVLIPGDMLKRHTNLIAKRFADTTTHTFAREIQCVGMRKDGSLIAVENHLTVFPKPNAVGVKATAWFSRQK